MPNTAASSIHSTTQQFLDIYDIANDMVIIKDGATAMILTVDALNFGLLAEEEQDAVMYAYAGLLNSLNYSIQIVIRSQTKDATNYLNLLKEQESKASSQAKQLFIQQYREFVSQLIRERNVLDKKFYIAIPATSLEMGLMPPQTVVPGVKKIDISSLDRSVIMERGRTILEPKRDHLISQFARIGLFARQLQTQEIIQLFYTSYNPEASEGQGITDSHDYTTALVEAQVMPTTTPAPQPAQPITAEPSAATYMPTPVTATTQPPLTEAQLNPTDIYTEPPAITSIPTASELSQPEAAVLPQTETKVAVHNSISLTSDDPSLTQVDPSAIQEVETATSTAPGLPDAPDIENLGTPVPTSLPPLTPPTPPQTTNVVFSANDPTAPLPPIAEIQ